jgi:Fanconi anemia group M protein
MYVEHPLIRPETVSEREYQSSLADSCYYYSTLVVLPTGLGKTIIALRVMAEILNREGGKALFLAPTKPLVEQHASYLHQHLLARKIVQLTGEVPPEERQEEWQRHDVIVSTPQVIANDLRKGRIDLSEVRLIVFDEAHRAVGRYAYVPIAQAYRSTRGRVLGITASPGGTKARIKAVCENLNIHNIESRSENSPDVSDHIHEIKFEVVEVELPERISQIATILRGMYVDYISQLNRMGFLKVEGAPNVRYVIEMSKSLRARTFGRKKNGYVFKALGLQAMAIKIGHALELAETQGMRALSNYIEKVKAEAKTKKGSKASQRIAANPSIQTIEQLLTEEEVHPKMPLVTELVYSQLIKNPNSKVMVFTNYRDSCEAVYRNIVSIEGVRASKLIGQTSKANDKGQKQKEQVEVLEKLRSGAINAIVATCVGEEGLDVANTDLVIFYEPVPSEIRSIQRRGRTGRSGPGRVVVLVTKGTSDEPALASSLKKERTMKRNLIKIQQEWTEEPSKEQEVQFA